jgi:hypothetical protein
MRISFGGVGSAVACGEATREATRNNGGAIIAMLSRRVAVWNPNAVLEPAFKWGEVWFLVGNGYILSLCGNGG